MDKDDYIKPKMKKKKWREKRKIGKFQKKLNVDAEKLYRKAKFHGLKEQGIYLYYRAKERVLASIALQLIVVFVICMVVSVVSNDIFYQLFKNVDYYSYTSYEAGIKDLRHDAERLASRVSELEGRTVYKPSLDSLMGASMYDYDNADIFLTDQDGNTVYANGDIVITHFDIHSMIRESLKTFEERSYTRNDIYTVVYPVKFGDIVGYLIYQEAPEGRVAQMHETDGEFGEFLAFIASAGVFVLLFFYITRKKIRYIEYLSDSLLTISGGDLKYRVDEKGSDELNMVAQNINIMAQSLDEKITAERRAEKTKRELITNVSHDLRTPLTSIIGYLGLVKEKKFTSEDQMAEYVQVAYRESEKIKKMLDDLFDYSRLSSNSNELKIRVFDLSDLIGQTIEEYKPRLDDRGFETEMQISGESIVSADPEKIHRVFDNLIVNAIKYGVDNSKFVIKLENVGKKVVVSFTNECSLSPDEDLDKLFDRFYRGDKSRSSQTSGSGLGLAICKQIISLHNGEIKAELIGNKLSFVVELPLNR